MKKILATFAVTASFAGSAIAADLPVKARPMMPAPVVAVNWTGCYVGAGGGYGMWNQEHQSFGGTALVGPLSTFSTTTGGKGWFGTAQVGCDYQFAQRWVVGAFADFDWNNQKGNFAPSSVGGSPLTATVGEEKQKWTWSAGARLGYLITPGLLGYVAGGYTETRFGEVALLSQFNGLPTGISLAAQTYKGWFIGTGYEYQLDFLPGLFWKTEYRYSDYKSENVPYLVAGTPTGEFEASRKYTHAVRSELVYRFNFGGPVVAKY